MLGSAVRMAVDLGRLLAADCIEAGARWMVGRLRVDLVESAPPPSPIVDRLEEVSDEQLAAFMRERYSMTAPARPRRPQQEDQPPNDPPIGSFEWRERQARPSRPG